MKILLINLLLITSIFAHHDKEREAIIKNDLQIVAITEKISEKPTPALYTLRAQRHVELGARDKAVHDLEHALILDKNFQPAINLLKQLQ